MNWLLWLIAALQVVTLWRLNRIDKEQTMANENAAQEDADIVALTASVNTFLTQLTAFLAGLPTGALTDQQQADLTALKTAVTTLSTSLPSTTS